MAGLSVIVAGGGIGGLSAALALAQRGSSVRVFERRAEPGEAGAGIQIGPNGTRILADLGVADRLSSLVSAPAELIVRDGRTGSRLAALPLGSWLQARHGAPYWTTHRADLHDALRATVASVPGIEFYHGAGVDGFASTAAEVSVLMADGRVERADLLVIADGVHSRLRARFGNAGPPHFAGRTAARAVVPAASVPSGIGLDDVGIWLAPSGHVVHYPVRAGRELALVVITKAQDGSASQPEAWATPVVAADIAAAVSRFPAPVRAVAAAASGWKRWSLVELPRLPNWVDGRAALLGDAAHPVLPFLASGAVLAIEDAVTLAGELAGSTSIEAALASYQARRQPRVAKVQAGARRNGTLYHAAGPLALARDATMRLVPPQRLMRSYDWLYGWRTGA
ncbi:MAG: FAD-dependent monooxygenase [Hyphomicrobiaceae bacterium]|nr:FAD-dependent monooxygenase [Hyphomicrobiaceae bacterium]